MKRRLVVAGLLWLTSAVASAYQLDLASDKTSVRVGDTVTFTLTITNDTGASQANLEGQVFFALDDATLDTKPAACTVNVNNFDTSSQTHLDCPVSTLADGESASFEFSVIATEANQFNNNGLPASLFLYQDGVEVSGLRADSYVWVYFDTTTDTDQDGVSDYDENLMGTNPDDSADKPGPAILDLYVLYTAGAVDASMGDVQARIAHLVAYGNQVLADSGIDAELRLAAAEQVDYSDTTTDDAALNAMDNGDGVFADMQTRRQQIGADMVVLMRKLDPNSSTCGLGNIGGYQTMGDFTGDSNRARMTSVISIDCPDNTMIHELGHNLGLRHSRLQDGEGGTFAYALGYGVDSNFVTVMAYASAFNVTNGGEIDLFSNVNLDCNGLPCGVDKSDPNNGADAVYTVNTVAYQVSKFYDLADADDDGTPDLLDAFPNDPSEQLDTDGDGIGNNADTDDDGDGTPDATDAFPLDASEQVDTDGDGIGNNADTDDDNDDVSDADEISAGTDPLDFWSSPLHGTLDIDGDGQTRPLSDGLLILRHLSGFSGTTLTAGAVNPNATRATGDIETYLSTNESSLDVDGNGTSDALTDGILVLRELFGFSDSQLIEGAVGANCQKCTAAEISHTIKVVE